MAGSIFWSFQPRAATVRPSREAQPPGPSPPEDPAPSETSPPASHPHLRGPQLAGAQLEGGHRGGDVVGARAQRAPALIQIARGDVRCIRGARSVERLFPRAEDEGAVSSSSRISAPSPVRAHTAPASPPASQPSARGCGRGAPPPSHTPFFPGRRRGGSALLRPRPPLLPLPSSMASPSSCSPRALQLFHRLRQPGAGAL